MHFTKIIRNDSVIIIIIIELCHCVDGIVIHPHTGGGGGGGIYLQICVRIDVYI